MPIEEKQKAIDGIHSEFWLESTAAKIIAMLAFAALCAYLFWQGLQKPPKLYRWSPERARGCRGTAQARMPAAEEEQDRPLE